MYGPKSFVSNTFVKFARVGVKTNACDVSLICTLVLNAASTIQM